MCMTTPTSSLSFSQLAGMSLNSRGGPSNRHGIPLQHALHAGVQLPRRLRCWWTKPPGQVRVTRYVQAQDVGVAINPMSVEGQLEGGVVQGIGRALTEDMLLDMETGAVRTSSLSTYLMPLAVDLPEIENILIKVPAEDGPFGARAVAEPPGFGPPGCYR